MQATASFASTSHNHKNKNQKKEKNQTGKSYASNVMLLEGLLSYHLVIIYKSRRSCLEIKLTYLPQEETINPNCIGSMQHTVGLILTFCVVVYDRVCKLIVTVLHDSSTI